MLKRQWNPALQPRSLLCTVDILPGTLRGERTHEYHCDDVIAISTLTIAEQEPPQALGHEEFHFARTVCRELQVVASNGDRPTIPVMIHGHEESKRARGPDGGRYRVGTARPARPQGCRSTRTGVTE
jgi:hypothetical protein